MLTARAVFWLGALYGLVCGLCLAACGRYVLRRLRGELPGGAADYAWGALVLSVVGVSSRL